MSNSETTSTGQSLRCPACHARQPLQAECRRCRADLSLVVGARNRIAYLVAQREAARRDGDPSRQQQIDAELLLLSPSDAGA